MTSSILPTLILPPNPPLAVGHRNATKPAAANVVRLAPVSETVARLRNWRRLTPKRVFVGRHPHGGCRWGGGNEAGAAGFADGALDGATGLAGRQVDLGVLVAAARLSAERTGAADVGATSRGDEHDADQHDDDEDGDGDDCCGTHRAYLTDRRTSRRATAR